MSDFDLEAVRLEFPVLQNMLYLDSAHQTPLATSVRAALENFYREGHETAGPKAVWIDRVETVRGRLAALLGAEPSEIAFTKNTSEGLNIAANAIPFKNGDKVLMIHGDHPNNAYAFLNLRRKGVDVRFVSLIGETANAETFAPHIDERTRAVSLSHVTFHAGHRFNIAEIGKLCVERGIYLVVDAMQSSGIFPIDASSLGASMIAFGCHKGMLVPHGLGILWCRLGLDELEPAYLAAASMAEPPSDYIARPDQMYLRHGAGRFEIGNLNLPDVHALSASLDLLERVGVKNISEHVLRLGDRLIEHLDHLRIGLVGPRDRANRSHIYTLDLPVKEWLAYFTANQVRVSPERDGIRVSFGLFNSIEDVDRLADIIQRSNLPRTPRIVASA